MVESLAVPGSSEALSTIRELDVRFVVSTSTLPGAGEAASPYVERTRLEGGVIYEVRWTPEALAALDAREDAPPPPPGPVPFAPGERAIYDVFWEGGPLDVAAGTVTLTARHTDEAGAQWQFELYAETADWVSAFFTARDRFTTTTDAALLPLVHHREIREGRRALDRSYKYDRTAGVVEAGGVTLPLASVHARDALSALYYVRTLPLDAPLAFPVSEAGRNQVVDVPAAVLEEIDRDGGRVPAWRLTPRLVRRIERRRPPAVIVWLAADEPRVPLRAVVDAGFGTIRLELREYRP